MYSTTCHGRQPRQSRRAAFTLVELLVVVAIIAILVSILLPTLQQAMELTRQAECRTYLRTIQHAWWQYCLQQNDGRVMTTSTQVRDPGTNALLAGSTWAFKLREIIGDRTLGTFFCPSTDDSLARWRNSYGMSDATALTCSPGTFDAAVNWLNRYPMNYSAGAWFGNDPYWWRDELQLRQYLPRIEQIQNANTLILFTEGARHEWIGSLECANGNGFIVQDWWHGGGVEGREVFPRHGGYSNLITMSGEVQFRETAYLNSYEAVQYDQLWRPIK